LQRAKGVIVFRYVVLGLLRNGEKLHGYALMKVYRARSGTQISTGNFYRELQRLAAVGLVRPVTNPAGADPRRAPYEITEAGAAAYDAWLSGPNESPLGQYDDELSTRALFVASAEPAVTRKVLDRWQEELWMRGKMIERARETASRYGGVAQESFSPLTLLLARRLKHVAADLEFIEELRAAYEEGLAPPPAEVQSREHSAPSQRAPKRRPGGPVGKR
jgi:DNA-binding PadR family transcriptional regulator